MAPPSSKHQISSSQDNPGGNAAAGLLVPHSAYSDRGDKLTKSSNKASIPPSRKALVPPSAVIPIEQPKRKKRKYHPELVTPSLASHSHQSSPVAPHPSQPQKQSQQDLEFLEGNSAQWDNGIYVGANNHPLFDISAIPVEPEETSKGKVI
jgi:hypothetical protein